MISIIANLKLKLGIDCVSDEQLGTSPRSPTTSARSPTSCRSAAAVRGRPPVHAQGGLHVAAVLKQDWSYQHVDPALVGNDTRILVSELAGRHSVTAKLEEQRRAP